MKAIIIGLGSMGRRRIRLLRKYHSEIEVIGVDLQKERQSRAFKEYGIKAYDCIDCACQENTDIEVAFVSTSPLSHSKIIQECLNRGYHVFSEINLVEDGYSDNMQLADKRGLVLFLSSTLMYRKEVEYIKSAVENSISKKSYIYHVGQYLPDWHPWENYNDFFVADKRSNGCRELMAIEFPWIFDVFGYPTEWHSIKNKNSSLNIDYPDLFQIMLKHPDGTSGMIQIDLVSRKSVRNFECISENLYVSWDGTPNGLYKYDYEKREDKLIGLYDEIDSQKEYNASIIEDAYHSEIIEFFDTIRGRTVPRYDFERDRTIISVIDAVEGF